MKFLMKRFVALMAVFAVSYSLVHGAEAAAPAFEPLSDPESAEFRAFTQAKNREILEAYEVVRRERAALRTGAQSWPAIADNIHFNGAGFVQKGQIIYELIASLDVVKPNELTLLKHLCSYYNVLFLTVLRKVLAESPDRFYELNGRYHALLDHLFLIPDSRDVEQMRSKYGLMQEIALFMVSSLMLRAQHAVNQAFPVKERTKIATEMFIHQLFHEQEALADGSLTIGWYQFAMHKGAINSTKFPQDHMIEIFQPLVNVFNQRSLVGRVWDTVRPALPWVGAAALAAAYWYFRTPEAPAAPAGGAGVQPAIPPAAPAGLPAGLAVGGADDGAPAAPAAPAGEAGVPPAAPAGPAVDAALLPQPDFAPRGSLLFNPGRFMTEAVGYLMHDALPVGVHNAGVLMGGAVRRELANPALQQRLGEVAEAGGEALGRGALAATATAEGAAQLQAVGSSMVAGLGTPAARRAIRSAVRPVLTEAQRVRASIGHLTRVTGAEAGRFNTTFRRFARVADRALPSIAAANENVAALRAELSAARAEVTTIARIADQFCAMAGHPMNPFGRLCPGYVSVFGERPATAAAPAAAVASIAPVESEEPASHRRRTRITVARTAPAAGTSSAPAPHRAAHGDAVPDTIHEGTVVAQAAAAPVAGDPFAAAAAVLPALVEPHADGSVVHGAEPQAAAGAAPTVAAASASGRRLLAPDAATSVVGVGPTASALGALPPAQRLESGLAARAADAAEPTMSRSWFWVDWWNQLASIGAAVSLE